MSAVPVRPEDLAILDLRASLPDIRATVAWHLERGESPEPLLRALAARDKLAVADVVVGPKAPRHPGLVRAALEVADVLEEAVSPGGLYRRLAELGAGAGTEVLREAAARHPVASWLVDLSARVEREHAGATHLLAIALHPQFHAACEAHAGAGHVLGLIDAAAQTGRAEPACALLRAGHVDAAATAAARALDADPACPVVAWLAAVWGPEPDPLVVKILPRLRSTDAVRALAQQAHGLPRSTELLRVVLPGLAEGDGLASSS